MHSRLLLLLACSYSLYGSEKFPEPTKKFLAQLQQKMKTTPTPSALQEIGFFHATFKSAEYRTGKRLCCYAIPCVCLAPVGGSIFITAAAQCAVGTCCMIDTSFGCTDSFGIPYAELLATTHDRRKKLQTSKAAPKGLAKIAQQKASGKYR